MPPKQPTAERDLVGSRHGLFQQLGQVQLLHVGQGGKAAFVEIGLGKARCYAVW